MVAIWYKHFYKNNGSKIEKLTKIKSINTTKELKQYESSNFSWR